MVELRSEQRELLHKALMEAFPRYEDLERMTDFRLDLELGTIASQNQPYSDVALNLIKWARSKGKIPGLVEGAYKDSPGSPQLSKFYMEEWQSLIASLDAPAITNKQSDQQPPKIVELDALRHSAERSEDEASTSTRPKGNDDQVPIELFPPSISSQKRVDSYKNIFLSVHEHIELARNNILESIDLLRPEKNIYGDQCQFVSSKVKEAGLEIQEIAPQIAQLPFTHVPSYYLLLSEQAYFGREVTNVTGLLHQLSNHLSSLVVRKEIWDKLHKLKKSSQEMDNFIDDFSENVDKPKER